MDVLEAHQDLVRDTKVMPLATTWLGREQEVGLYYHRSLMETQLKPHIKEKHCRCTLAFGCADALQRNNYFPIDELVFLQIWFLSLSRPLFGTPVKKIFFHLTERKMVDGVDIPTDWQRINVSQRHLNSVRDSLANLFVSVSYHLVNANAAPTNYECYVHKPRLCLVVVNFCLAGSEFTREALMGLLLRVCGIVLTAPMRLGNVLSRGEVAPLCLRLYD